MQSGRSQSMVSPIPQRVQSFQAADTRGKHTIQAELKRLEQEARFLEEELEQIERMEKASAACKETNGPLNPLWDRWFEGPQKARGCKCWKAQGCKCCWKAPGCKCWKAPGCKCCWKAPGCKCWKAPGCKCWIL